MTLKTYKVHFTKTSCGKRGVNLGPLLQEALSTHGTNFPPIELDGDEYQFRELERIGRVWTGTFARLRADAPHIVDAGDQEREIDLDEGDRIVDKCHFLLREQTNVLIWQVNRNAGGINKAQQYLSQVLEEVVTLPQVMNDADIERVLQGQLYELNFIYARPNNLAHNAPRWNQAAFDMMNNVHAAQAKFMLRAPRGGGLTQPAVRMVRELLAGNGFEKIRVRLTDESDPIELFMAPLKDSIEVHLNGRYPVAADVYSALEEAYDRQRQRIAGNT